jgi:hypothetical protein
MKAPPIRTWPKPDELPAAPEIATLAVLEAALVLAELHLLVENPQLAGDHATTDPCHRPVVALLDNIRATTRSIDNYVRCARALAAEAQRDLPF